MRGRTDPAALDIPTCIVAVAVYAGWFAATLAWRSIPPALLPLAGGWLVAWHGSLQHEVCHGHPTRRRWLNDLIAMWPLGLWLPLSIYRESHLVHHGAETLTHPADDPESFYVSADVWRSMSAPRRALLYAMQTVVGRLLFGPVVMVARAGAAEARLVARHHPGRLRAWALHGLLVAGVVAYLVLVCRMPLWVYLLAFAYPGLALTLLRSFTEHRPAASSPEASAIVEAGPLLSLLFLNNNLHAVHHGAPSLAWHRLAGEYRRQRAAILRDNGHFVYRGYADVLRRFAVSVKDSPYRKEHS